MDAGAMKRYICEAFDGVAFVDNGGDTFFFYDAPGDQPPDRRFPFATIVTGDHYDTVSDLTGRGAYRLNLGLRKATYVALFGAAPRERDERGVLRTGADYAATDTLLPHPFYASQYWVSVVNPGPATLETVRHLLSEAYQFAVHKRSPRGTRQLPNQPPDVGTAGHSLTS